MQSTPDLPQHILRRFRYALTSDIRCPPVGSPVEAAFFDLDTTVKSCASVIAFGRSLRRVGIVSRSILLRAAWNGEAHWDGWRLSCGLGSALSTCLIAGVVVGVTAFVLDRAEHSSCEMSCPLPVASCSFSSGDVDNRMADGASIRATGPQPIPRK